MSMYYGFLCQNCGHESSTWLNRWHGARYLLAMIKHWQPIIKPFIQLTDENPDIAGYLIPSIEELGITGCHYVDSPIGFLTEHDGHTVVVRSEYDQIVTEADFTL